MLETYLLAVWLWFAAGNAGQPLPEAYWPEADPRLRAIPVSVCGGGHAP